MLRLRKEDESILKIFIFGHMVSWDAIAYSFSENFEELSGKYTCYSWILVKALKLQVVEGSCQLLKFSWEFAKCVFTVINTC